MEIKEERREYKDIVLLIKNYTDSLKSIEDAIKKVDSAKMLELARQPEKSRAYFGQVNIDLYVVKHNMLLAKKIEKEIIRLANVIKHKVPKDAMFEQKVIKFLLNNQPGGYMYQRKTIGVWADELWQTCRKIKIYGMNSKVYLGHIKNFMAHLKNMRTFAFKNMQHIIGIKMFYQNKILPSNIRRVRV